MNCDDEVEIEEEEERKKKERSWSIIKHASGGRKVRKREGRKEGCSDKKAPACLPACSLLVWSKDAIECFFWSRHLGSSFSGQKHTHIGVAMMALHGRRMKCKGRVELIWWKKVLAQTKPSHVTAQCVCTEIEHLSMFVSLLSNKSLLLSRRTSLYLEINICWKTLPFSRYYTYLYRAVKRRTRHERNLDTWAWMEHGSMLVRLHIISLKFTRDLRESLRACSITHRILVLVERTRG